MAQHLIHVGYGKAGSTFLQVWFESHSELCYQPGGLGGFNNVYELARPSGKTYKYYVTSYEGLSLPIVSAGGIHLDFASARPERETGAKKKQAEVCAVLKTLFPDSRVLIVTRGFKGLIISGYSECVRLGTRLHLNEVCREFSECLRVDDDHYWDFDYLIRLYRAAFGDENLIVMPYELLRDDQSRFLTILEEKLDISHAEVKPDRLNPSLSPEELYWYPLFSRAISTSAARLGNARFQKIHRWYVTKILNKRLHLLVKVLRLVQPDRKVTEADFADDILRYCRGKAKLLKELPLYSPYAAEYLWDE
ncbi:MAG TPA: hypothetical protein VJ875_10650 [Pyrinomonadaceae bacterium]|nr:hypothetical protein [Pyrinomonadaceae bacterium]